MRNPSKAVLLALALAATGAGCSDYLSSDEVVNDPNNPTTATRDQLFIGTQAAQFGQQEGILAIIACSWTQQCTGTSNFLQAIEEYEVEVEELQNPGWATAYEGGGLIDQRQIEASARADGDLQYLGIAQIWEALNIGTVASLWGDVPYRQAAKVDSYPTPVLDDQLQVYADLQALLSEAITNLDGAGPGPGARDFVYEGDVVKWKAAAHTLKARYYMHTAEVVGNAAYQSAIDEATLGISSSIDDWRSFHGSSNQEANMWNQFLVNSGFGGFLVAGRHLVERMVARNDPRLAEYFGAVKIDIPPFGPDTTTDTLGYVGQDPNQQLSDSSRTGPSALTGTRATPEFRQPLVTWVENQLILAEANFQLNGAAAAQPFVNAVRTAVGLPNLLTVDLASIMEEKYIALYQNIEVWNDYKRTCEPALTAFSTTTYSDKIPGRLYYSTTEQNANHNIPTAAEQLAAGGVGFRNKNDPNPCP